MVDREGLHLVLHAQPVNDSGTREWHSSALSVPFHASFQEVTDRLALQPRLFIEPDGSWVWSDPSSDSKAWQLDGQLNDGALGLMTFEVKLQGVVPLAVWRYLLESLDWPRQALLVQWCRAGVFRDVNATEALLFPRVDDEVAT